MGRPAPRTQHSTMAALQALTLSVLLAVLAHPGVHAQSSKPEFYVDFCNTGNYQSRDFWKLPAAPDSTWPRDGFCQALSSADDGEAGSYEISAELFSQRDCGAECGHAGIIYNADGQLNFDMISFMTYNGGSCYEYGYVESGQYTKVGEGACRAGNPKPRSWFKVQVDVESDRSVLLRLDGRYVSRVRPHFPARRLGGVLTKNGFNDLVLFKHYKMSPSRPSQTDPKASERRPDPCRRDNPCQNRGRCRAQYDVAAKKHTVSCQCVGNFIGQFCEKQKPCTRNPCQNGGRCTDTCSEPVCSCRAGFTGKFCEHRKCSVDFEECDKLHDVQGLDRAAYKDFQTCRKSTLRVLFKWRRCMAKKNRELQAARSCDCRPGDVAILKRYQFFGNTAALRAASACFIIDKYRNQLKRDEKCSSKVQQCAESLIEIVKGDPLTEVEDKGRCMGTKREMQEMCVREYLSREMDLTGCPMYTQFFRTHAPALETWLSTLCTDCPHRAIMRECFGNTTSLYEEFGAVQFCRSWQAYDSTRACIARRLKETPSCAGSADMVLRHVDYSKKFFKKMWEVPCDAVNRFDNIRRRQWRCDADASADVTSMTLPNGGAGTLYVSSLGLALRNTERQGRNIVCKSDLKS